MKALWTKGFSFRPSNEMKKVLAVSQKGFRESDEQQIAELNFSGFTYQNPYIYRPIPLHKHLEPVPSISVAPELAHDQEHQSLRRFKSLWAKNS